MIKIKEANGTEGYAFTKNTDYFEMSDGVFWTVDALMKKYDISKSTLYNKARDNNIPTAKIANIVCFKDSDKFNKIKSGTGTGNIEHLKGYQITTYAELHRKVEELIKQVRSATIPVDANTHSIHLELQELKSDIKNNDLLLRNQEQRLSTLKDIVLDMNECVHNILDELTKENNG